MGAVAGETGQAGVTGHGEDLGQCIGDGAARGDDGEALARGQRPAVARVDERRDLAAGVFAPRVVGGGRGAGAVAQETGEVQVLRVAGVAQMDGFLGVAENTQVASGVDRSASGAGAEDGRGGAVDGKTLGDAAEIEAGRRAAGDAAVAGEIQVGEGRPDRRGPGRRQPATFDGLRRGAAIEEAARGLMHIEREDEHFPRPWIHRHRRAVGETVDPAEVGIGVEDRHQPLDSGNGRKTGVDRGSGKARVGMIDADVDISAE